jgi:hypothetical protein
LARFCRCDDGTDGGTPVDVLAVLGGALALVILLLYGIDGWRA